MGGMYRKKANSNKIPQIITTAVTKNKAKMREAESGHFPDFEQVVEKADMQKDITICREKLRQN